MDRQKECSCCGHLVSAYSENLSTWLVSTLRKLVDLYEQILKPVKASDPRLNLTKAQYPTIQKLKYWGLVKKGDGNTWMPTELGVDFIYGRSAVQNIVAHLWDKILPIRHEARQTHNKKPKSVYVWEVSEKEYKQKQEYVEEKYWPSIDQSPLFI